MTTSADSHLLQSLPIPIHQNIPHVPIVHPWAWCCLRSHQAWPSLQYPVLAYPQGMAWSPPASPEDHPTLLGNPGWAVHRGQYSSEGRLHLHPTRAPQQNPCWPPWCSIGDWKNAGPSLRISLLARLRCWHHWLCEEMCHLHPAHSLSACSTNASQRHPQWPMAGNNGRLFQSQWQRLPPHIWPIQQVSFPIPHNLKVSPSPSPKTSGSYVQVQSPTILDTDNSSPTQQKILRDTSRGSVSITSPHPHIFTDQMVLLNDRWRCWRQSWTLPMTLEHPSKHSYWNCGPHR